MNKYSHVTFDYLLMLAALFLMKLGQFMLLPFLAIYLAMYTTASATEIGIAIGIGPFIYGLCGIGAGIFVDRFGVKKVMIGSLLFGSAIWIFFFYGHTIIWFSLMNILTGLTRAFSDISSKAYGISSLSLEQRKINFSLRFMTVNSAAALGPLIGAYFATMHSLLAFKMTGILYLILGLAGIFILHDTNREARLSSTKSNATLREALMILGKDKQLQLLLLICIVIWAAYSQIDSTLPQYLHAQLKDGVNIYSYLLITNALMCVTLQIFIAKLTKELNPIVVCYFSMVLFAASYIILALFISFPALLTSIVMMTLAEILLMPLNELLLSQIAPANRLGTYYGILSIAMLGLGIGPIMGGFIYDYANPSTLFFTCSVACILVLFIYKTLFRVIEERKLPV